mgnify:CR=1 FL=1
MIQKFTEDASLRLDYSLALRFDSFSPKLFNYETTICKFRCKYKAQKDEILRILTTIKATFRDIEKEDLMSMF